MAKYTEEQKAAVLARVSEIRISKAAKEAGIPVTTVSKWNKAAAVAEAQAMVEKAGKNMEKAETAAMTIIVDADAENKKAVKEARLEKEVAIQIEAKKKKAQTARKAKAKKEKVKAAVEKKVKKARAAKMDLVFETNGGMQIKPEEIVEKVPKGCNAAYVKLEENKIYWVKGEETGAVDIW